MVMAPIGLDLVNGYIGLCSNLARDERFFRRNIGSRFLFAGAIPIELVTCALSGIIGIFTSIGTVFTMGSISSLSARNAVLLNRFRYLLSNPYIRLVQIIDPSVQRSVHYDVGAITKINSEAPRRIYCLLEGDGLLTSKFKNTVIAEIIADVMTEGIVGRNILLMRMMGPLLAIGCLITRLFDAIIALPAAALGISGAFFSLLTGRPFLLMHHVAYRGLQVTGIVHDLVIAWLITINPRAIQNQAPCLISWSKNTKISNQTIQYFETSPLLLEVIY